MTERTHIPGSPACGQWETLLADALDGLLKPADEATFTAHMAACPACAALYEEARKGREWLAFLSPEPEAPQGLLEKILAHTGPGHAAGAGWGLGGALPVPAGTAAIPAYVPPVRHPSDLDLSLGAPVWQQPGFLARMRSGVQPRLLMTAAMAFFSIALTLNMAGVRLTSLRLADMRPQTVRSYMERQLTMASVPIVRYYDHLRFVYEVESRVRELRGKGEGEGNGEQRKETRPVTPGQTRQENRDRRTEGTREQGRKHPAVPVIAPPAGVTDEILESTLTRRQKCAFGQSNIPNAGPSTRPAEADFARDDTIRFSAGLGSKGAAFQDDFAWSRSGSTLQAWERIKVWIAQTIAA